MSKGSDSKPKKDCPGCNELEKKLADVRRKVDAIVAELVKARSDIARLKKNSSTSSKPPSSDIVKPPREKRQPGKRKIGAQPGHDKHERPPFTEAEVDEFFNYELTRCPDCGHELDPSQLPPRSIQQVEILKVPIRIDEHRGLAYWCPSCQKVHYGKLPPEVRAAGLLGEELTSFVAYLKGVCHASFSTIRKLLRDMLKFKVSRGYLRKVLDKVTTALDGAYLDLLTRLPLEPRLNVDETGHKDNGTRMWTWCFRASLFTLFKIDASRGSGVLVEVLGEEFDGVLGCDYFSAYRKYMGDFGIQVQFCLSHLIRDVKFLTTFPDRDTAEYGKSVLACLKGLFKVIHQRDELREAHFRIQLEVARAHLVKTAKAAPLGSAQAANLAKRFELHGDAYTRFITTPGADPTNNLAEQAIRFVVIDRKITQGTRSERGQRWCERIWTILATCTQQGRDVFEFIRDSVHALFHQQPAPSLLPAEP